jgi:hypothetical protein
MTRQYAFNMLNRVQDELESGRFAIRYIVAHWHDAPILTAARRGGRTRFELRRCSTNLEKTFTLRLFAEFESTLRDYWQNGMKRTTEPGMFDLMESIVNSRSMNSDDLAVAHRVRELRNDLVHENVGYSLLDFKTCLQALGRYLRWLPLGW